MLSEEELLVRDATRNIGEELLAAIRDVKAGNIGASYLIESDASQNKEKSEYSAANINQAVESKTGLFVILDSDVAEVFKNSTAVNNALRAILSAMPR